MQRVLLNFVHGLGDAVQFTVVLKHLRRHRPDWQITVRAGRGKESAFHGLCHRVMHDQEPAPDAGEFESGPVTLGWYENYAGYPDRPNTKITNALAEVFGLGWDADLGSYQIQLGGVVRQKVCEYLRGIGCKEISPEKFNAVVIHYEGNTSVWKKNLKHYEARSIIDLVVRSGRVPVVLDWDGRSTLPDGKRIFCPRVGQGDIWGGFGSGDAATIAALVHCSEAFVGIDSGPGKCASSTKTPTLIIWRDHHPIQFHDPADSTTHLIPNDWKRIPPCEKSGVPEFFEKHYKYTTYSGQNLVQAARDWLSRVLQFSDPGPSGGEVPYVVPNGIGDVTWALLKLRSIAGDRPIDIMLSGDPGKEIDQRAVPFLKHFPWVRGVEVLDVPVLQDPEVDEKRNDSQGRYRYVPDGLRNGFHFLVPNRPLEAGQRLEEWLPEHALDWSVIDEFKWEGTERGADLAEALVPFAALYLGPESGNVDEGHNRGFLWEPKHWVSLARLLHDRGLHLAVVGASYDRSYWERYCRQGFREMGLDPVDLMGKLAIGETLAFIRKAKVFISYQCGLGVLSQYFGVPTVMWWRADGNSAHPKRMVAFSNDMKDAWTRPEFKDRYYGAIYLRETPGDLMAIIEDRGWLK